MGLRIIYGKSGSGKSEYIYNEINEKIKNNEKNKIYIITPEQFSLTAEQKLMKNKKSIINAEIITFDRLAYRTINEIGGIVNTNLSKCGKAMLIYSILQNKKNELILLNKTDENVELSMRIITELKKHGILIQDLKREQEKIEDKYLKNKLKDIILIYENTLDPNKISKEIVLNNNLSLPILENENVCYLKITYDNQIYKYDLIVKEKIEPLKMNELIGPYLKDILF